MWILWSIIATCIGCYISYKVDDITDGDFKFQIGMTTGMLVACIVIFN